MLNGGPENFLNRLSSELDLFSLPKYIIVNPNPNQRQKLDRDCLKIGRLDGAYYYKSTSLNLYNLFLQKRDLKLPWLKFMPDYISQHMTKPLNWHLNRGNRMVMKHCDCLVFQSKLSKRMHEIFVSPLIKKKIKLF